MPRRGILKVRRLIDELAFPAQDQPNSADLAESGQLLAAAEPAPVVDLDTPAIPFVAVEGERFPLTMPASEPAPPRDSAWKRVGREIVSGVQTLLSAGRYG